MAKFRVTFKIEVLSSLTVEADSIEEAKEKAFEEHLVQEGSSSIFVDAYDENERAITYTGEILDYDEDALVDEIEEEDTEEE